METYHKVVLAVAVLFLFIILITIGIMIPRKDSEAPWPPVAGHCPDGWTEDAINRNQCAVSDKNQGQITTGRAKAKRDINKKTSTLTAKSPDRFYDMRKGDWLTIYGTRYMVYSVDKNSTTVVINNSSIDGEDIPYIQSTILFAGRTVCDKKRWANKWGVDWDGVSNYNKCL